MATGFAHGKVLLFGEHAVVYGQPAVALGTARGISARASRGPARLRVGAWSLDVAPGEGRVGASLQAILRVLRERLDAPDLGATLDVDTSLPAGAGLGSSAALAVACARALAADAGATLDDATLFDAAMASERVFHGNPSGLDHAVAMHGGVIRYVRGETPTQVKVGLRADVVVAQVAAGADTGAMVAGVAARREKLPSVMEPLLSAFGGLAEQGIEALATGDAEELGALFDMNQALLGAIGVSTPALDAACAQARAAGALGAKLTGAGGGGCVIALTTPEATQAVLDALSPTSTMTLVAPLEP